MSADMVTLDAPLHLIATSAGELSAAHTKMLEWVALKIERCDVDLQTEQAALEVAVANGWIHAPFQRRINQIARRRAFYVKIGAAVEAGYAIVPNFGMDTFAIRTDREAPKYKRHTFNRKVRGARFVEDAKRLPSGDGEYRNPTVPATLISEQVVAGKYGEETHQVYDSGDWNDFAFPVALAKPALMTATQRAMALKVFDEIGVADASSVSGDPFILGRIKSSKRYGTDITFFIGWYFDPSRL